MGLRHEQSAIGAKVLISAGSTGNRPAQGIEQETNVPGMAQAKVTPLIRLHAGPSVPCQRDWHTGTVVLLPRKTV